MAKEVWMSIPQFCHKYNINEDTLRNDKHTGRVPSSIFKKIEGSRMMINSTWHKRRLEFVYRVKLATQDLYYLLEEYYSDRAIGTEIARLSNNKVSAGSVSVHFKQTMFASNDEEFTQIYISKARWFLFRYWWSIERRLRRRGTSIEKILDRRMELD